MKQIIRIFQSNEDVFKAYINKYVKGKEFFSFYIELSTVENVKRIL
jgi:hypothetical protein